MLALLYVSFVYYKILFYIVQTEKAFALYEEALTKGITLDVETFNSLLAIVNFLRENPESRLQLVKVILFEQFMLVRVIRKLIDYAWLQDILMEMSKQGLRPNIGTLNSSLESVSFLGNKRLAKQASLQLLSEFNQLGVKPSLGTYYFLLTCFCKDRNDRKNLTPFHYNRTCDLDVALVLTLYMITHRRTH